MPSHAKSEDTIKVTAGTPAAVEIQSHLTASHDYESEGTKISMPAPVKVLKSLSSTEAFYYELETPAKVELLQLPASK